MNAYLRPAIILLIVFTLITGVLYPLAVTFVAQAVFPRQANGSLLEKGGKIRGSELIGQQFTSPKYFWSRLSATGPFPYNAASSSGSNYGPLNPALLDASGARVRQLRSVDSLNRDLVPVDLATASGSGLDPHISVAAAVYQVPRVARERGLRTEDVRTLVDGHIETRDLGFLGEPRVNVLKLNLALDDFPSPAKGDR